MEDAGGEGKEVAGCDRRRGRRTERDPGENSRRSNVGDEMLKLRREYLQKQISALAARVRMLKGEKLKFDDESRALYDAVAPTYRQSGSDPDSHFDQIIAQLETKIPGKGPLWQRYEEWRKPFVIPKEKLDTVFQLAIKECRARTLAHVALPPNESFTVEYVTNKPWGGYNWYKGNFHSVIQVNTDLPIFIDRAVDLAAHEGYPGHHVYNSLLEKNLVRDRGWMEFSVYPLFSPQSLVAEGTANFGRDVAFPTKTERMKFEKEVLFPAAGIDSKRADEYYAVQDLMKQLDYAVNEAARRLINGEIDESAAVQWLQKYAVMEPARAQQRVKFIQRYRSYVINYNLGEDMVRRYIEKRSGTDPEKRWSEFAKLLSSPRLPSGLQDRHVLGKMISRRQFTKTLGAGAVTLTAIKPDALWSGEPTATATPASVSPVAAELYRKVFVLDGNVLGAIGFPISES